MPAAQSATGVRAHDRLGPDRSAGSNSRPRSQLHCPGRRAQSDRSDGRQTRRALNPIGDFGGGGLLLAFGIACALLEARQSGKGQVVDAAMLDGAASFMAMFFGYRALGQFDDKTGTHFLGGGAHYYDVYEALDGRFLSVASIEPQFYSAFLRKLNLDEARWREAGYPNIDPTRWPALKAELIALFRTRTRDDWISLFAGSDVCVTPVLTLTEALTHPHNQSRETFIQIDGVRQNAPAPRFSRTVPDKPRAPPKSGADTDAVLDDWGISRYRADGTD